MAYKTVAPYNFLTYHHLDADIEYVSLLFSHINLINSALQIDQRKNGENKRISIRISLVF